MVQYLMEFNEIGRIVPNSCELSANQLFRTITSLYECVQSCYTHKQLTRLSGRGNLIRATTPLLSIEQYRKQQRT